MSITITCARCGAAITSEDVGEALTWNTSHDEFCPALTGGSSNE
jgi:hypothetical protein